MIKKRLMAFMGESKKWIYRNIALKWAALMCNAYIVLTLGWLLERLLTERPLSAWPVALAFAAAIARCVLVKKAADASANASGDIKRKLRQALYAKLLRLPVRQGYQSAEVLQLSVEGIEQLDVYFSKYLPQFFYSLLAPLTLFAVLCFFDPRASAALLALVPLIPMSIMVVVKFSRKTADKYWSDYTRMGNRFLDNLQGLTALKTYNAEQRYHDKMNEESERFRKITMKVLTIQLNSITVMDLLAYGSAAIGSGVALSGLASGRMGLMAAFGVFMLAAEFFIPLRLLGSYFHIAMNGMAASDKMFALLDLPEPERPERPLPIPESPRIELRDVCFSYSGEFALQHIDMAIAPGEIAAFVGESGCGKSSLAALIAGSLCGYTGQMRFGDVDAGRVSAEEYGRRVMTVKSQSYLFKGTLRENLRVARPDAADERMIEVLRQVNLWGELGSLDCAVYEQGANLSGGQRQRVALARALLFDAHVYIFDEATSGIDAESEETIMRIIKAMRGKTVILISHRLYNVADCKNIYVLKNGAIAEHGDHAALMAASGDYCRLVTMQSAYERGMPA